MGFLLTLGILSFLVPSQCNEALSSLPQIFELEGDNPIGRAIRAEEVLVYDDPKFDPVLTSFINKAIDSFGQIEDQQSLLIKANQFVHDWFSRDLSRGGWLRNPFSKLNYHRLTGENILPSAVDSANGRYRLGALLRTKCGMCRHQVVALLAVLERLGIEVVYYVSGSVEVYEAGNLVSQGRHAWAEITETASTTFILDPANRSVMRASFSEESGRSLRVVEKGDIVAKFRLTTADNAKEIHDRVVRVPYLIGTQDPDEWLQSREAREYKRR